MYTLYIYIMLYGVGPSTPWYRAGIPGQRKPDSQSVWFRLILEPGFLLFFGTGQFVEVPNPVAARMFTLLDFRSENRILVVTISAVSMRQDSRISICLFVFCVGGEGVMN